MFKQVFCNHKTIFLSSWTASAAKGALGIANIFVMQYMIDAALSGAFFMSGKWLLILAASYVTIQLLNVLINNLKISINNHIEREVDGAILKQCSKMIIVYEVPDVKMQEDNGRYLSIDLGLHNLLTCYDNKGRSFILGRKYLSICRKYDKEIARLQSQWGKCQTMQGIQYPKPSKHQRKVQCEKNNSIRDYLHKITHYVAEYCQKQEIHTVVIGDITGIRKGKDLGKQTNQKLHGLPYARIYMLLEYKLAMQGIRMIRQEESYSSQCSPCSEKVSKEYAEGRNRCKRGMYKEDGWIYQADAVGAYNILRKYCSTSAKKINLPVMGLSDPKVIKVAV